MALLIADSGSTKTSWVIVEAGKLSMEFETKGLNPYHSDASKIPEMLSALDFSPNSITEVHFYGAGVTKGVSDIQLHQHLNNFFKNAEIHVENDLLGAARSSLNRKYGMAVILGTGSNFGLYQNGELLQIGESLGFHFGDEAGGAWIGRRIIRDFYYGFLPKELHEVLVHTEYANKEELLEHSYHREAPNRYIGGVLPKLGDYIHHPHIKQVFMEGLDVIIKRMLNMVSKKDLHKMAFGFTGSIAKIFQKEISIKIESEFGARELLITKSPIQGMVKYHSG